MGIREDIDNYRPCCEQEQRDKAVILDFIANNADAFLRTNLVAHMTASAWVVDSSRERVLMVYHNIYDSWSWTGGHADGDEDLLAVALRECREETGVETVRPVSRDIFSLEVLTVDGHEKRGEYVSSHLHMNVTYLLEADVHETLRVREGENSGVRWFGLSEALEACSEPWFVERVYKKLNSKLRAVRASVYAVNVRALSDGELYARAYAASFPARRAKADRLLGEGDKRLALGAGLLLCRALTGAGVTEAPEIAFGEYGKPYLKNGGKHFSISHSGDWAVCAVSDAELGCDVERLRPIGMDVTRRFAPDERERILAEPDETRLGLFFRCWTLKESFMKATGLGIRAETDAFSVAAADETGVIRSADGRSYAFWESGELPGHCLAVCAAGDRLAAGLKIVDIEELLTENTGP